MKKNKILLASFLLGIGFVAGVWIQKHHLIGKLLSHEKVHPLRSVFQPDKGSGEGVVELNTRVFQAAVDTDTFQTEKDSKHEYEPYPLDLSKTALILIDVWKEHPNEGWMQRADTHRTSKIVPLLELAREQGITIIHAPHGREIAEDCQPLPECFVIDSENLIDDTEELDMYLKSNGISTLLYAGYSSNWCILHRPVGIIAMSELGYDVVLVRNGSIAFETPKTLDGEWAHRVTVNMIEYQWGRTTTLEDLQRAFSADTGS